MNLSKELIISSLVLLFGIAYLLCFSYISLRFVFVEEYNRLHLCDTHSDSFLFWSMEKPTWTVVHFKDENTVEAVPTTWIYNNKCVWPPLSRDKIINSIKRGDPPNPNWPSYEVIFLRNSTFNDYLTARNKAKKAESTSDLNSSDSEIRKIVNPRRYSSSSDNSIPDNEISHLPSPPKMQGSQKGYTEKNPKVYYTVTEDDSNKDNEVNCSCCSLHPQYQDIEKLVRKINILQQFVVQTNEKIENLGLKLTEGKKAAEMDVVSVMTLFDLPFNTSQQLDSLETYLSDDTNLNNTIQEISKMGGKTMYEFIKRTISIFITDELGSQYSWLGRRGKKPFIHLKLTNLLIDSAKKCLTTSTNKDAEEAIQKWLRRSRERDQNKKKAD